jgi:hypothetical protein
MNKLTPSEVNFLSVTARSVVGGRVTREYLCGLADVHCNSSSCREIFVGIVDGLNDPFISDSAKKAADNFLSWARELRKQTPT